MKLYKIATSITVFLFLSLFVSGADNEPITFRNPILPGFFPDPSICRVDDTYYLVNSSFEWYPGLPIHKSKDLVNWELIGYGLHRPDQIVYKAGLDNSHGIFAPSIRHHEGTFYIITTMVGQQGNFIITAKDPAGPWSDPMWIEDAPGIDPSLFWEEDGKCYYTGAGIVDGTQKAWPGKNGVWMQEIDPDKGVLKGEKKQLTYGHASNARWAEGPHLYKIDGEYLLLIGEGGTGEYHSVTVFNSENLWGPYIPNHANPVMTHRHLGPDFPIGQTGHADMVQTPNGDWWSVMLAKRKHDGFTTLARETFLAKVEMIQWESGVTPLFNPGKGLLQSKQERPQLPWTPVQKVPTRVEFDTADLDLRWNFLRSPQTEWYQQKESRLILELRPEMVTERVNPSFIAQRTRDFDYEASTRLVFSADKPNEKAGLVAYRRHGNNYQLLKSKDSIQLIKAFQQGNKGEFKPEMVATAPYSSETVVLKAEVTGTNVQFYYGKDETSLKPIGKVQDYTIVSDEIAQKFNGVFIGMYATSSGENSSNSASFDWFEYEAQ